jgi:hypothetical protein
MDGEDIGSCEDVSRITRAFSLPLARPNDANQVEDLVGGERDVGNSTVFAGCDASAIGLGGSSLPNASGGGCEC